MQKYVKFIAMLCFSCVFGFISANAASNSGSGGNNNGNDGNNNGNDNIMSMLGDVGKGAITGYAQPLVTTLGTGMNSGWYVSAKPLSMFGKLPFGVSIGMVNMPVVVVDNSMKTFDFTGEIPTAPVLGDVHAGNDTTQGLNSLFDSLKTFLNANPSAKSAIQTALGPSIDLDNIGLDSLLHLQAKGQPTIFGSDSTKSVTMDSLLAGTKTLNSMRAYNASKIYMDSINAVLHGQTYTHALSANDTINLSQTVPLPFQGIGNIINDLGGLMFSLPSVGIEVGASKIPVIGNLTLGLRYIPEIDLKSINKDMPFSTVGLFGFKVQYEYLHLLPFASTLPIHSSVIFAENGFHLGKSSDTVYLSQSNWLMGVNASVDVRWAAFGAGLYTGIAYESSSLDLAVKLHEIDPTLQDFSMSIPGANHFRFTIGPRINIGPIEIFGAANFGSVTSYNLGVTLIALNGRGL